MSITTIYYAKNILEGIRGLPVDIDTDATLNVILGAEYASDPIPAGERPKCSYLALGSKGAVVDCANDEITRAARSPTKAVLYNHIPFTSVAAGAAAPADYRLRVRKSVNGTDRDFFFLKYIPPGASDNVVYNLRDISDPSVTTEFDLTDPVVIADIQSTDKPDQAVVNSAADTMISVDHKVPVVIAQADFEEIRRAAIEFYSDVPDFKINIINEIALCTGIEGPNDVIAAQLAMVNYSLIDISHPSSLTTTFTLGTKDPLYTQ